jgi:hypothetical protein
MIKKRDAPPKRNAAADADRHRLAFLYFITGGDKKKVLFQTRDNGL